MPLKKLLFSFRGRITRQTFWLTQASVSAVLGFVLMAIGSAAVLSKPSQAEQLEAVLAGRGEENVLYYFFPVLALLCMAASIWISLAVQVKRWHDRGKSAWMVFLPLVPIAGILWVLVETGFLRGSAGANRYGEDPLEAPGAAHGPVAAYRGHFVFGAFPLALLFLTMPVFFSTWRVTSGFERLAAAGLSYANARSEVGVSALRPLWFGAIAFVVILVALGGIQAAAGIRGRPPLADSELPGTDDTQRGGWLLIVPAALAVPTVLLLHHVQSVVSLIMLLMDPGEKELAANAVGGKDLAQAVDMIMKQLAAGVLGASVLSAILVFVAGVNVRIMGSRKARTSVAGYSWALLGAAAAAAVWLALRLGAGIHRLEDVLR